MEVGGHPNNTMEGVDLFSFFLINQVGTHPNNIKEGVDLFSFFLINQGGALSSQKFLETEE